MTAPAGYGKTTLAREWLQGRDDVAWYRATAASADVAAFSAGLADAMAPARPRSRRAPPAASPRRRRHRAAGAAAGRAPRRGPRGVAGGRDHRPRRLPPRGRVGSGRGVHRLAPHAGARSACSSPRGGGPPGHGPALPLRRGYEIGRDQLAMTDDEAALVLEGRSTEAVRALVRQAEGWPALIGLAALSAELAFPKERVSDSLYRYFAEEVLRTRAAGGPAAHAGGAPCPARSRSAWPRTCSASPIPEPALLSAPRRGPTARDPHRRARLPPAHPDFLRRRLEGDDPERLARPPPRSRRRRASARALGGGVRPLPPTRAARTRRPRSSAAPPAASWRYGQGETLEKWLAACGAAGVTVPGAALARAELLIRKGEMSAATAVARDTARPPRAPTTPTTRGHAMPPAAPCISRLRRRRRFRHSKLDDRPARPKKTSRSRFGAWLWQQPRSHHGRCMSP